MVVHKTYCKPRLPKETIKQDFSKKKNKNKVSNMQALKWKHAS